MKTEIVEEKIAQTGLLKEGHSLIKLENEVQMSISIQRPRDEKEILKSCLDELDIYRSFAEDAIYSKPVGKDPDTNKMKYAEGLSIRVAESLANRWSNSAYGVDKIAEDDDSVTLAAVFLDYENNTRHLIQRRVAKSYRAKGGRVVQYSPDRFEIVMAAKQSIILREIILRSLPAGLKLEYEKKVRQVLEGGDIKKRIANMVKKFKQIGISEDELCGLRKKLVSEFEHEDITELLGVYNALKDGELTKESLFEDKKPDDKTSESKLKVKNEDKPFAEWIIDKKAEYVESKELESFNTTLAYLGVENPEKLSQIKDPKLQEKILKHFTPKGEQAELALGKK